MKYLLDTDWIIDHFRNDHATTDKLKELASEGIALSIISLAEIYEGIYHSRDPDKSQRLLDDFLAPDLEILGINEEVCKIFGKERGNLRKKDQTIGDFDLMIASIALHNQLTVLTNNRKHFEKVDGLKIISIQNVS